MTAEREDVPERLTFSQRHGYEPLPEPMRLEEISGSLRRELWNAVRLFLLEKTEIYNAKRADVRFTDARFIERVLGRFTKRPESHVSTEYEKVMRDFDLVFVNGKFNNVLDLLEIMVDELSHPDEFASRIGNLFDKHVAAYWLDMSQYPYRFFPRASGEQGEATRQAIETVRQGGMDGSATHLRQAAEHINAGQYADSIADSIHAVESVARTIDPGSGKTLGPALKSLERAGVLKHPALGGAFEKLYGYTNDEQGVRHALLDRDAPDVGLDEAMFMFGACASFAAYLTGKHRRAGGA